VVELKTTKGETVGINDTGAGTAKSLSIPRSEPVFRWKAGNDGTIRVYHLLKNVATITFYDGTQDKVCGTRELQGNPELDAISLVFNAEVHYHTTSPRKSPFTRLLEDKKAMKRLSRVLQKVWSGE
jgi:hypothetical protein